MELDANAFYEEDIEKVPMFWVYYPDVRNVLKDNRVDYKTFYYNLRSSVNEDFSNTVNYAYSRANFLFDEDEEVIYWLSEYSSTAWYMSLAFFAITRLFFIVFIHEVFF